MLANRIYLGEAVHKGVAYPGEHVAIINQRTWDKARAVMAEPAHQRGAATRAQIPALLKGLIHGPNGRPMSPSHTRRHGRIYRYYVAREVIADGYATCAVTSVPAADVEGAVLDHVQNLLAAPELVARTWATAKRESEGEISEREVTVLLADFATVWNELFPAEQARIVQLLASAWTCRKTRSWCGSGPRGWRASSAGCGSTAKGKRHDLQRRDSPRRHHSDRAHSDALPAPRKPQAHRRP